VTVTVEHHVALAWIERVAQGRRERVRDEIAVEEPLEIRVDGQALAVAMRTPGEDEELAVGFLAGEALIGGPGDIAAAGPTADLEANVVEVRTTRGLRRDPSEERRFHLSSSCGICGKGALEFVNHELPPPERVELGLEVLRGAPEKLRGEQPVFDRTGGLHATGIFERDGRLLAVREDVGRHNAMDKVLGALLLGGRYPLPGAFAAVSGRASFELVQKAALARLAGLVAVGPPSSLAVDLAWERGMVLCGFARAGSLNVYAR
jgi:FdhD protein